MVVFLFFDGCQWNKDFSGIFDTDGYYLKKKIQNCKLKIKKAQNQKGRCAGRPFWKMR